MELAIFLPILFWLVLAVLFSFSKSYSLAFRILVIVILLTFIMFWWAEIMAAFKAITIFDTASVAIMLKQFVHSAFLALIWVWPLSLLFLLLSGDNRAGAMMLLILTAVSILLWAGYLYFGFHHSS